MQFLNVMSHIAGKVLTSDWTENMTELEEKNFSKTTIIKLFGDQSEVSETRCYLGIRTYRREFSFLKHVFGEDVWKIIFKLQNACCQNPTFYFWVESIKTNNLFELMTAPVPKIKFMFNFF